MSYDITCWRLFVEFMLHLHRPLGSWGPRLKPAKSAVPNRGFPDPWESETRFSGVRNKIVKGESLYVLGCRPTFFQTNRVLWKLATAITQKNIIQLTTLIWQFQLLNVCFAISASRCSYHNEDDRWCDC